MTPLKYSTRFRLLAFLLIFSFLLPANVYAMRTDSLPSRASDYLTSYNTYLYNGSLGKIQIWFSVTGVEYMDDIGVLTIQVYESTDKENWSWVETYKQASKSGMLAHDTIYYSHYVQHQGTIGRFYKAYVTIWAGKDGSGDTRYMWTDIKKATLFAG